MRRKVTSRALPRTWTEYVRATTRRHRPGFSISARSDIARLTDCGQLRLCHCEICIGSLIPYLLLVNFDELFPAEDK
jgi:hypothetical protein